MTTPKPVRLQRSRAKGARLVSPNGLPVVCVTRPGRWGNPTHSASYYERWLCGAHSVWFLDTLKLLLPPSKEMIRAELRGKNLACWCKPGAPCHADVLLEIANE